MLPFHFSVLLLLILVFHMDIVMSACPGCFGKADGCTATSANECVWVKGVTTNVAAIGTATTATLVLTGLLPGRVLRLFPRAVLQTIASLACKASASAPVDISKLSLAEMRNHILSGDITSEEACLECMSRQDELDESDENYAVKSKVLTTQISVLTTLKPRVHTNGNMEGTLLYILCRLSSVLCGRDSAAFDVCIEIPVAGDVMVEGGKRLTASVTRPHTLEQFMSLLNQYRLVCHTTGVANICAMSPFLDDVVYEPLRLGTLSWPVTFELLLIYLRIVDTKTNGCTVADVYASTGGIDAKRDEAQISAHNVFPDSIFRNLRGEPRDAVTTSGNPGGEGHELFEGQVLDYDASCKKGCVAWNDEKPHLATHVGPNGACKFFHGCNQYVTDKGPGGQCLDPNHSRHNCTYDPSKKCSVPHKE